MKTIQLGLIINPIAGIGGRVGLKGSDHLVDKALALGAIPLANQRCQQSLQQLIPYQKHIVFYTANGEMGADTCATLGFDHQIVYQTKIPTSAEDTQQAALALSQFNIDLLLFVGGDGTARNLYDILPEHIPVLGIPAGCKIHSGVYAISPVAAAKVVEQLILGEMLTLSESSVMDIDEQLFTQGQVRAKHYGELLIPSDLRYVQAVKMGGKESDELVLSDIAAQVEDMLEDTDIAIMGSGSTIEFIMQQHLGLTNTLLGVDVLKHGELIAQDVRADELLALIVPGKTKLFITPIGGQGHIFGRGNQQLSPEVIKAISEEHIHVVATKKKLQGIQGGNLKVDTGDVDLDHKLQGYLPVITGYRDQTLVAVG